MKPDYLFTLIAIFLPIYLLTELFIKHKAHKSLMVVADGDSQKIETWMQAFHDSFLKYSAAGESVLANPFDNCGVLPNTDELNILVEKIRGLGFYANINTSFERVGLRPHLTVAWEKNG